MRVSIRVSNEDLVRSKILIEGWKGTYVKKEKNKRPLRRETDLKMLAATDQVEQHKGSKIV